MKANDILHHANYLFEKYRNLPVCRMTIVNRLFIGMLHAKLNAPIGNYTDFPKAIKEIQVKCTSNQEKDFILGLYQASRECDLNLKEIDLNDVGAFMARARKFRPEAFPPA